MRTLITFTPANADYSQVIDELNYACDAQEYIDDCRTNNTNDNDYWADDIGGQITASVYDDAAEYQWAVCTKKTVAWIC